MITEMNSLVASIRLSETQTTNECFLEEDEEMLKSSFNLENDEKSDKKKVADFDKKEDYELAKILEDILLTSSLFKKNVKTAFHIQLLIRKIR